jgi:KaiC/GvpD/RAD55 family RecA-like ATPase
MAAEELEEELEALSDTERIRTWFAHGLDGSEDPVCDVVDALVRDSPFGQSLSALLRLLECGDARLYSIYDVGRYMRETAQELVARVAADQGLVGLVSLVGLIRHILENLFEEHSRHGEELAETRPLEVLRQSAEDLARAQYPAMEPYADAIARLVLGVQSLIRDRTLRTLPVALVYLALADAQPFWRVADLLALEAQERVGFRHLLTGHPDGASGVKRDFAQAVAHLSRVLTVRHACEQRVFQDALQRNHHKDVAELLNQALILSRAYYPTEEGVVLKRTLGAEWLWKAIASTATGIPEMRVVFRGGLELSLLENSSALICGDPGTGKSTLTVQLLAEMAKLGHICIYLHSEESGLRAQEVVREFHFSDGSFSLIQGFPELAKRGGLGGALKDDPGKGVLALLHVIPGDVELMRRLLDEAVPPARDECERTGPRRRLVVAAIDSLESVMVWTPPSGERAADDSGRRMPTGGSCVDGWVGRREFEEILSGVRKQTDLLVLVSEDPQIGTGAREKNLCDLVLLLREEKSPAPPGKVKVRTRTMQVVKSRRTPTAMEASHFDIVPGAGIEVFPSLHAANEELSNRTIYDQREVSPLTFGTGVPGLDDVFGTETPISQGSVTAILGPSGLAKHLLSVQMAMAGYPRYDVETLLIVGFEKDRGRLLHDIFQSRHLKRQFLCALAHDAVTEVWFPPSDRPAAWHYWQVHRRLTEQHSGKEVRRAVVLGTAAIQNNYPGIDELPLFLSTLGRLLKSYHITSFIPATQLGRETDGVGVALTALADNVIRVRRLTFFGRERVGLVVERSLGRGHSQDVFEMRVDVEEGRARVSSGFDGYTNVADGEARPAHVTLSLYHETTHQRSANRAWEKRVREALGRRELSETAAGGHFALIDSDPTDIAERRAALKLRPGGSKPELNILQLDEYLMGKLKQQSLADLSDRAASRPPTSVREAFEQSPIVRRCKEMSCGESACRFHGPWQKTILSGGRILALPYYQNVSLLMFRPANLPSACERPTKEDFSSWQRFREYLGQCRQKAQHAGTAACCLFDFPRGIGENWNTMFLEAAIGFGKGVGNGSLRVDEGSSDLALCPIAQLRDAASAMPNPACQPARTEEELPVWQALTFLREFAPHPPGIHAVRPQAKEWSFDDFDVDPGAIFSRTWFTLIPELASQRQRATDTWEFHPLPDGIAMSGDWYLGIEQNSLNVRTGLEIVLSMTSAEEDLKRLANGVGLPVGEQFWRKLADGEDDSRVFTCGVPVLSGKVLHQLMQRRICRAECRCYEEVCGLLPALVRNAVCAVNDEVFRSAFHHLCWCVGRALSCAGDQTPDMTKCDDACAWSNPRLWKLLKG